MSVTKLQWAAVPALFLFCSSALAATLVEFQPSPVSPTVPEFQFSRPVGGGAPVFRGALGSTSNNDGNLPILNQTAPGFDAQTPFILAGPGALNNLVAGTTDFLDSSLQFTGGLQANAPALFNGGVFIQPLSAGSFQLLSTGPAPILLLSGDITGASFIVGAGSAGAVFASQDVTYTGGIIFNALVANGLALSGNSMSLSMTDITPLLGIANDGFLNDFSANATGLFNYAVPEPSSLTLLVMALGGLLLRRR